MQIVGVYLLHITQRSGIDIEGRSFQKLKHFIYWSSVGTRDRNKSPHRNKTSRIFPRFPVHGALVSTWFKISTDGLIESFLVRKNKQTATARNSTESWTDFDYSHSPVGVEGFHKLIYCHHCTTALAITCAEFLSCCATGLFLEAWPPSLYIYSWPTDVQLTEPSFLSHLLSLLSGDEGQHPHK